MLTTLAGVFVIASAIWSISVRGRIDLLSGMLFPCGALLVVNGLLRQARMRAADAELPAATVPRTPLVARITAVHVVLVVAVLEVAINRVAVPMLRPRTGAPPTWHTLLDYTGLFLFYFTGVLAALVIAQRCVQAVRERGGPRALIAHGLVAVAALLAAIPLVVSAPASLSLVLELAFAVGGDRAARERVRQGSRSRHPGRAADHRGPAPDPHRQRDRRAVRVAGQRVRWAGARDRARGRDRAVHRRAAVAVLLRAATVRARGHAPGPGRARDGDRGGRRDARADVLPRRSRRPRRSRSASS